MAEEKSWVHLSTMPLMMEKIKQTTDKFLFIWDMNGYVPRFFFYFFQYRFKLNEFAQDYQRLGPAAASELLRKEVVEAMRKGEKIAINLGLDVLDFAQFEA